MKRLVAVTTLLAALATACAETGAQPIGPAPSDEPVGSPSPSVEPTPPTPTPTETPTPDRFVTYEVWFSYDGMLFLTHRTESFVPAVGSLSLESLFEGPTRAERNAEVGSSIVPGTTLLGLTISEGLATVNLDDTFVSEETPAIAVGSLAQVVYTLTQFDSVEGVRFQVNGSPLRNFGGYELGGPQRRVDFLDQLPAILVTSPTIGERVDDPIRIAGTADVFEAVVSISIYDQAGRVIASSFTMATCGTGCRGTYETEVRYDVGTTQPGTVRVYEVSAMDGSSINVVDIPVTLTA
jgi:hypothetical protein